MKITRILQGLLPRFALDQRGNVAMITALLAIPLVGAVGAGIDYTRLVSYRLKLDTAATSASLAAIDTARALLLANPKISAKDLDAAAKARAEQVFTALAPPDAYGLAAFLRVGDTLSAKVEFTGDLATTFMGVLSIQSMNARGASNSTGQIGPAPGASDPSILVEENFDVSGITPPGDTVLSRIYTDFNNWKTGSGGVEIGKASTFGEAPPNGAAYVAELDVFSNSFMARKTYLTPGTYELRYYYKDRIVDPNYAPTHVCGSSRNDVAWATTITQAPNRNYIGVQSHAITAYLEPANTDNPPAAFLPTEHAAVDTCILSSGKWIERSVKITTYATGFYWLAFQAEGTSDGFGGVITGIRLCANSCPGTVMEHFPWTAGQTLFSDGFETPIGDTTTNWRDRTLDASGTNSGWTNLPTGWTTWPENQMDFQSSGATLVIELDASGGGAGSNRSISRRFILNPGYYALEYFYSSRSTLSPAYNLCGRNDVDANLALAQATNTTTFHFSTAIIRTFIDPDLLFSHPYSDPVLRAQASWFNPDDTPATLPRLPSSVVDACVSSNGFIKRSVNFRINKTGFYWLTFQAGGTADAYGGVLDDVTLKALGPLSISVPADAVAIPFGGIAPGSIIKKRHLQFIAN